MPTDWPAARATLAAIPPAADAATHTRAVAAAYGLTVDDLAPLLAWADATAPAPIPGRPPRDRPLRSVLAEPAAPAWARRPRPDRRHPAVGGRVPRA